MSPPFKTSAGPPSMTKCITRETTSCHQARNQTFRCSRCDCASHRLHQARTCMQSTWATYFLRCVHKAKPWKRLNNITRYFRLFFKPGAQGIETCDRGRPRVRRTAIPVVNMLKMWIRLYRNVSIFFFTILAWVLSAIVGHCQGYPV